MSVFCPVKGKRVQAQGCDRLDRYPGSTDPAPFAALKVAAGIRRRSILIVPLPLQGSSQMTMEFLRDLPEESWKSRSESLGTRKLVGPSDLFLFEGIDSMAYGEDASDPGLETVRPRWA